MKKWIERFFKKKPNVDELINSALANRYELSIHPPLPEEYKYLILHLSDKEIHEGDPMCWHSFLNVKFTIDDIPCMYYISGMGYHHLFIGRSNIDDNIGVRYAIDKDLVQFFDKYNTLSQLKDLLP